MNIDIKKLLVEMLSQPEIIASWGFHDLQVRENGISFRVDALNWNGVIVIEYVDEEYVVKIGTRIFTTSTPNEIISLIDAEIELTSTYQQDIYAWIKQQM